MDFAKSATHSIPPYSLLEALVMISHAQFGELRLAQFRTDEEIEDWEYMDRNWVGEAIGF
jgi:hypothetical protein